MMELYRVLNKTRVSELHKVGLDGNGVKIAVLDSGIDCSHDFFNGKDVQSIDLTGEGCDDFFSHGTHIASIISAIAPQATIYGIKILNSEGNTKVSLIMKGIEEAVRLGCTVINISVGGLVTSCPDGHPLDGMVNYAQESGCIVIASAGNGGPKKSPHIPAAFQTVISVGSVSEDEHTNRFSSKGPACNRTYPDCVAYGDQILAAIPNNEWGVFSGTSQSTAQVSGIMALLFQYFRRSFTKEEVELFLSQSCVWIETPEKNNSSGWGIIDAEKLIQAARISLEGY